MSHFLNYNLIDKLLVKPKWYITHWEPKDVTAETIAAWQQETVKCDIENRKIYKELTDKRNQLIVLAGDIYGKSSKVVKYLEKQSIDTFGLIPFDFKGKVVDKVEKYKTDIEKAEHAKKIESKTTLLKQEAIVWLQERGKKLGIDFILENVVETANDIAWHETVNAHRQALEENDDFMPFGGDDNCSNCRGWDGVSHRCDCGNRRVSWSSTYGFSFKNPEIYAEAN